MGSAQNIKMSLSTNRAVGVQVVQEEFVRMLPVVHGRQKRLLPRMAPGKASPQECPDAATSSLLSGATAFPGGRHSLPHSGARNDILHTLPVSTWEACTSLEGQGWGPHSPLPP